jgi:hypothetical protein
MSYEDLGGAVVFLDVDQADELYPSGGRLRLLLHGSSKHLVGPGAPELPPRVRSDGGSMWPRFVETVTRRDEKDVELPPAAHPFLARVVQVLDQLNSRLQPVYTAGWVAGYARVTAVIPTDTGTLLAATPLHVEHVATPV